MKWVDELYRFYHFSDKTQFSPPMDRLKEKMKKYGYALPAQSIIGEVELIDIVRNSKDIFAVPDCYLWVLKNPLFYDKPIPNILGKLRLWDYEP
jgi:hypothetical protein